MPSGWYFRDGAYKTWSEMTKADLKHIMDTCDQVGIGADYYLAASKELDSRTPPVVLTEVVVEKKLVS